MTPPDDAHYRLEVAELYLAASTQDLGLGRWRETAVAARNAIENGAKAILACFGSVPRTHEPGDLLDQALGDPRFPAGLRSRAVAIRPAAGAYGMEAHLEFGYGDEKRRLNPWKLVTESRARDAQRVAVEAVALARDVIATLLGPPPVA